MDSKEEFRKEVGIIVLATRSAEETAELILAERANTEIKTESSEQRLGS